MFHRLHLYVLIVLAAFASDDSTLFFLITVATVSLQRQRSAKTTTKLVPHASLGKRRAMRGPG